MLAIKIIEKDMNKVFSSVDPHVSKILNEKLKQTQDLIQEVDEAMMIFIVKL